MSFDICPAGIAKFVTFAGNQNQAWLELADRLIITLKWTFKVSGRIFHPTGFSGTPWK